MCYAPMNASIAMRDIDKGEIRCANFVVDGLTKLDGCVFEQGRTWLSIKC